MKVAPLTQSQIEKEIKRFKVKYLTQKVRIPIIIILDELINLNYNSDNLFENSEIKLNSAEPESEDILKYADSIEKFEENGIFLTCSEGSGEKLPVKKKKD